jgi:hypothetical protein
MATEKQIKKFMLAHWEDHLDDSGCLNMTSLAEDAAIELNDSRAEEDIPEEYFEIALAVQEALRKAGHVNS